MRKRRLPGGDATTKGGGGEAMAVNLLPSRIDASSWRAKQQSDRELTGAGRLFHAGARIDGGDGFGECS